MTETAVIGSIVDISGSTQVDLNSQTEPNQAYCFVKEANSIAFQIPNGMATPTTWEQVAALTTYKQQVMAQLASTDVEFVGAKFMCARWYPVQDILGTRSIICEAFRAEIFVKDKGGIAPLAIVAVCIGVGVIITAIAIAFTVYKLSPEQLAQLITDIADDVADAAKETGIGLIIVFAVVVFLILYLTGGSFNVGKGRTKVSLKAGKVPASKSGGDGNLKV